MGQTTLLPDGTAVRDYVHVMDLGLAHIRAISELSTRERLVSNVGTGSGVSVRELVTTVEKELAVGVNVEEKPIRAGDPPSLVADNQYLLTWFDHDFKPVDQPCEKWRLLFAPGVERFNAAFGTFSA